MLGLWGGGAGWVADNKRRLPARSLFGLGKGGWCQLWPVSWLLPVQLLLSWSICPPCLVAAREGLFLPSVPLPQDTLPLPPQLVSLAEFSVLFSPCKAVRLSEDINLKWTSNLAINTLWKIMNLSLNLGLKTVFF